MALRGFWGFDGASAVMCYPEWSNTYSATTGRDGVANHANALGSNSAVTLTLPGGAMSSLIAGYAIYRGVWLATLSRPIARFMSGGTTLGSLYFSGANTFEIGFHNTVAEVAVTSGLNWVNNVDHYFEVQYTPHATAGLCKVRVDGIEVMNFTGKTAPTTTSVTAIDFVNGAGSGGWIDDMYLLDTTDATATEGRPNNDFLGDVKVAHAYPSVDLAGNVAWTPSTGTNHAALVDENPVNTTDFVSSVGASGQVDLYDVPDLPGTAATVYGVRIGCYAQKSDSGAAAMKAMIRENATSSEVGATLSPGITFGPLYSDFVKTRPSAAGVPFTVGDVNGMQVGVKST